MYAWHQQLCTDMQGRPAGAEACDRPVPGASVAAALLLQAALCCRDLLPQRIGHAVLALLQRPPISVAKQSSTPADLHDSLSVLTILCLLPPRHLITKMSIMWLADPC